MQFELDEVAALGDIILGQGLIDDDLAGAAGDAVLA